MKQVWGTHSSVNKGVNNTSCNWEAKGMYSNPSVSTFSLYTLGCTIILLAIGKQRVCILILP